MIRLIACMVVLAAAPPAMAERATIEQAWHACERNSNGGRGTGIKFNPGFEDCPKIYEKYEVYLKEQKEAKAAKDAEDRALVKKALSGK